MASGGLSPSRLPPAGIERDSLQGSYLSRLLADQNGSMLPADEHQMEADKGLEFRVTARLSRNVVEELGEAADAHRFILTFR